MTNKDRLLCLFESEGLDISSYVSQKESSLFNNPERKEYLSKNDSEINQVMKNKNRTYLDLCKVESALAKSESRIYEKYPNNPYLFNYKNNFLCNQKICDCIENVNGEQISLERIASSDQYNEKEVFREIKLRWLEENKEYISKRKKITLEYVEGEYYNKGKKLHINKSNWFGRLFNIFLVISFILLIDGMAFGQDSDIASRFVGNENAIWMTIFFFVYTVFDFLLILGGKDYILDGISNRYNRMLDYNDHCINKLTDKQMLSKNKLQSFDNFRRQADEIDYKYLSINKTAPFVVRMNIINSIASVFFIIALIFAIVAFGFLETMIVLIIYSIIKAIFQS